MPWYRPSGRTRPAIPTPRHLDRNLWALHDRVKRPVARKAGGSIPHAESLPGDSGCIVAGSNGIDERFQELPEQDRLAVRAAEAAFGVGVSGSEAEAASLALPIGAIDLTDVASDDKAKGPQAGRPPFLPCSHLVGMGLQPVESLPDLLIGRVMVRALGGSSVHPIGTLQRPEPAQRGLSTGGAYSPFACS